MIQHRWINSFHITLTSAAIFLGILLIPFVTHAQAFPEPVEPVSGRTVSLVGILPADVLARTVLLRDELEVIRFEMGKPKDSWSGGFADNASPHEVYFQAMNLFLKANRLSLELVGSMGSQPQSMAASNIHPFHVWLMVDAAYQRILAVKRELGLSESISERLQPTSTTMTEAGRAIVVVNRQINLVLERPFSPSDVKHQVSLAIQYAADLLKQFPDTTPMPDAPPFERGKQPTDVFLRLLDCYERLETIAKYSNVPVLHFNRPALKKALGQFSFHPSDVYDMATLLVSDLAFIHSKVPDFESPDPIPYPGRTFPSHTYQQAGVLYAQLAELEQSMKDDPEWFKR